MGYYSSRKPYYDLTKSQVEFFAGSSRFLKQSLVKESVMEKPYLEDEYQKMHLAIPPPIWPDPYPPGPFGPIYGLHIVIFPPPSCSTISATNFALDCGDVAVLTFRAYSFFEETWSWSWQLLSTDFPVSNISVQDLGGGSVALSTNVRNTVGVLLICGIGTAGLIPLVWEIIWEIGAPVPMLSKFTYTQVETQDAVIRCCTEVEFNCISCPGCENSSISYTTQQMVVNESQNLSVNNPVVGCVYNWAIASGGGSLSAGTGTSVIYTAPSSNPECVNNPIITLSTEGNVCDTLSIAITALGAVQCGYEVKVVDLSTDQLCIIQVRRYGYRCDGSNSQTYTMCDSCSELVANGCWIDLCGGYVCSVAGIAACNASCQSVCGTDCVAGFIDNRTEAQKAAGCCPEGFL